MKSLRFMLPVVLMSLTTVAFAQSDAQKSDAQKSVNKPAQSDAFDPEVGIFRCLHPWHPPPHWT